MSLSKKRDRPYSLNGQISRMQKRWPNFQLQPTLGEKLSWVGDLSGFQRTYRVGVLWDLTNRPYVYLIDPPLMPRQNGSYEDVPHLMFNEDDPMHSGLCLFDPDGHEWSNRMLIADTTLPWAAKWLYYYELWLFDGIWRGGGIGPESITQARREAFLGQTSEHTSSPEE